MQPQRMICPSMGLQRVGGVSRVFCVLVSNFSLHISCRSPQQATWCLVLATCAMPVRGAECGHWARQLCQPVWVSTLTIKNCPMHINCCAVLHGLWCNRVQQVALCALWQEQARLDVTETQRHKVPALPVPGTVRHIPPCPLSRLGDLGAWGQHCCAMWPAWAHWGVIKGGPGHH